ncbi:MAG: type II toxin-antitoxin system RelE/ParE family toxin [Pseudomonadales bacterium]|nr:type II toxin-antitoxin system RelE/ParE family toxin [Candidatus Woesebacteria bacterium]MCB9801907.1 type II toxin-antitoxin system RelE/ParE family toxin [Pseudomonadales bacterium]
MKYTIKYKKSVEKDLRKLSQKDRSAVVRKIVSLGETPRPAYSIKLKGSVNLYRLRHGAYRIIYQIFDTTVMVVVVKVGHRKDVYKP